MAVTTSRSRKRSTGDEKLLLRMQELVQTRDGSYLLIRALVERLGGSADSPIQIQRAEWKAPPPGRKLRLERNPETDDVTLWIEAA